MKRLRLEVADYRCRIMRRGVSGSVERTRVLGWPWLHVSFSRSDYHHADGSTTRDYIEVSYCVRVWRGAYISGSIVTDCYPDTGEDGWPS